MADGIARAAGPGGGMDGDTYNLTHTGAQVDAAVTNWYAAQNQADATAADIVQGKKAIIRSGLVTGTRADSDVKLPAIPAPQAEEDLYFMIVNLYSGANVTFTMLGAYSPWTYSYKNVSDASWSSPATVQAEDSAQISVYTPNPQQPQAILVRVSSFNMASYWFVEAAANSPYCLIVSNMYHNKAQLYPTVNAGSLSLDYQAAYNLVTTGQTE